MRILQGNSSGFWGSSIFIAGREMGFPVAAPSLENIFSITSCGRTSFRGLTSSRYVALAPGWICETGSRGTIFKSLSSAFAPILVRGEFPVFLIVSVIIADLVIVPSFNGCKV